MPSASCGRLEVLTACHKGSGQLMKNQLINNNNLTLIKIT